MSLFESEALNDAAETLTDEASKLFWQSAGWNKWLAKNRARPIRRPHGYRGGVGDHIT
jgi:hypothetical protein